MVQQANCDEQLIGLWLHGKSPHTQRRYQYSVQRLRQFVDKPLHRITLGELQGFSNSLADTLSDASRNRVLSAVKSLMAFGHRIGYLRFDVGRVLRLPNHRDDLSQRILNESEVKRIIALEPQRRNRIMLMLAYAAGLRVSEVCSLRWRDLQSRRSGGQATIFGKGGKTRVVLLPTSVWREVISLRGNETSDCTPVFPSRRGGHLRQPQVWRIVRAATRRVGIEKAVSPHWLRHAHASHALDHGAGIHLVQTTLGHSSVATTGRYLHARPNESSSSYLGL